MVAARGGKVEGIAGGDFDVDEFDVVNDPNS